ncbi:MAG: cyanamide hydratase [Nostocoides sp.]
MNQPLPPLPDTAAARAAYDVCQRFSTPNLLAHSTRSYLWAGAYAAERGLDFDAELLHVSAMVHDLGIAATFEAVTTPFEVVGAEMGFVVTRGLGWPADRSERVVEICIRHMRDDVAADVDVESHLLQVGTSADVSGVGAMDFPAPFREALFVAYPRTGFPGEFVAAFEREASRKPGCAAARLLASDWAQRMATNPLPA